jgi:RNA polymerase sigma-70 factor (ECF subfamily)
VRSDAELLEAWRTGDVEAGRTLFERHIGVLSRFFRNKVGDEREDLIQRTLLACVESRDRLRDGASFRAYLLRVARSRLYDHVMRVRGGPNRPDPLLTSIADAGLSPSRIMAKSEQDHMLLLALRRLPLELQVALELHYWEGLTTAELADVLEIPQGTVKTRLFRARNLLRDDLHALARASSVPTASLDDLDAWAHSLKATIDDPP